MIICWCCLTLIFTPSYGFELNILFQKISRLEKDNSKLLEEKEKLQKTKESILLKFNNIGCYPSIRICSCGIRLKSGQDVSATETRGSGERDNGVTQQK